MPRTGADPPLQDDPELLRLMLVDERMQSALYRPGPYWAGYQRRVERALRRFGVREFRRRPEIGKGYSDTVRKNPAELWLEQGKLRHAVKLLVAMLPPVRGMLADAQRIARLHRDDARRVRDRYYQSALGPWLEKVTAREPMPDTTVGGSEDLVTINGQDLARIYVSFLIRMETFAQDVAFGSARTAMEIGGGFGAWVHLLLSRYPNVRKVAYIDIPPMIYVGTQYLRHFYGDSVVDYRQTRTRERIAFKSNDALEILCLCPWQIESLDASIDVFWNSASFREMPPDIIRNYARHVDRLLGPAGTACLYLEDPAEATTEGMTPAQDIMAAFPGYAFTSVAPEVDIEGRPRLYAAGRKAAPTGS